MQYAKGKCIVGVLYRLKKTLRRKRPGVLQKGVTLQHDNATPHTAKRTTEWLQRYGWEVLPHPAHSPDLAPSDYYLFGPLKRHLGGKRFDERDDLVEELNSWFSSLDADFFKQGIYSLSSRWQKCTDRHGNYMEK